MFEGFISHFKSFGVLYIVLFMVLVFFSILMLVWRKIILSGKKIEYTIMRPNGNLIRGKVDPKEQKFKIEGYTYIIEKEGITHREGKFGHIQTILYIEKIPHPVLFEKVGIDKAQLKIIQGDTLSELFDHKLVKEFLDLHDSNKKVNWIALVGGIIVFLIIVGIVSFIVISMRAKGAI